MAIHGWSVVCHSNSGVRGYSDIGVGGGGIAVGPWTVSVTPVYGDTLTKGGYSSGYPWMVHGLSEYSNSGVRGYSDIGGGRVVPRKLLVVVNFHLE